MGALYTPTFGGTAIFGVGVQMRIVDPPRRRQFNNFIGINGTEALDLGSLMRQVHVTGKFSAPDQDSLTALLIGFMSWKNDFAYTLVTTTGLIFPQAVVHDFETTSKVFIDNMTGAVWQDYRASFLDLGG